MGTLSRAIYEYFERYRRIIGETLYKRTSCAWTYVRKEGKLDKCRCIQQFVCDRLGFAHDISSDQLEGHEIDTYGGAFLSGHVRHASTIPVGVDEDGLVSLSPEGNIPIPFAWGR